MLLRKPCTDRRADSICRKTALRDLDSGVALIYEPVGQSELQNRRSDRVTLECFEHSAACTARHDILLDRDKQIVASCEIQDERLIERLYEPHVDDCGTKAFRRFQGGLQHRSKSEYRDFFTGTGRSARFAPDLAFSDRQRVHLFR